MDRIDEGIAQIKANIAVLETSADQDRGRIKEYRSWLELPNYGGYNKESLEEGINKLKINVAMIETTIDNERSRIKELRTMQDTVERKQREQDEAVNNFIIKH